MQNQQRDSLRSIAQDARRLIQLFKPAEALASSSQQKLSSNYHLTIPMPPSITSIFIGRGLELSIAEKMNQAYLDRALSLKTFYEGQYLQTIEQSLTCDTHVYETEKFIGALQSSYISRYYQHLQDWQSKLEVFPRRQPSFAHGLPTSYGLERRSAFKNESVPLLEQAFTSNAYPSRGDKTSLAAATGMEYKQVNIWFQNRRARSKKEGLSLQRTATFATQLRANGFSDRSTLPIPHLMEKYEVTSDRSPEDSNPAGFSDLLTVANRPAHAFPTPYPPLHNEDSPPTSNGAGLFDTPWPRKGATDPVQRTTEDSIEQLIVKMANITLSSDTHTLSDHVAPLPSFVLVPPRAPLPALIRAATASSGAQPFATLVNASGISSPKWLNAKKLYRALPTRLPNLSSRSRPLAHSFYPISASRPETAPHQWNADRSRRPGTRSPSPSHSSRSSSLSSVSSSRSTSSSWSVASSIGPLTPPSTSPRVEALTFAKDTSPEFLSHRVHRSSSVVVCGHIPSLYR